MSAEPPDESRIATPFLGKGRPSIAFVRLSEKHPASRKNTTNFNPTAAEEFCTFKWVRCRSGAPNELKGKPKCGAKSIYIKLVESLCDGFPWHLVCNHNLWNVPAWRDAAVPEERSKAE
jgi:hypothetical protein